MSRHIANKVVLLTLLPPKHCPQHSRLHKVLFRDRKLLRDRRTGPSLVFLARLDGLVGHVAVGGWVVWIGAVVAIDGHDAVALVGVECAERLVDRDLLVVDAEAVAVGVWVGEEAGLEDWIGRRFDAWNHMGGGEGDLLDLGEVILWVAVEGKFAEAAKRDVFLGPDFCEVENVPTEFFGFFRRKDLEVAGPAWVVAALDGVEEVLGVPVWVFGGHVTGFTVGEGFAALVGFAMNLDVVEGAIGLGELIGVAGVAVHVPVGIGGSSVGEEVHDLVGSLLVSGEIVPEPGNGQHLLLSRSIECFGLHCSIFEVGLRVTLLSVNEDWELGRVAEKEDGRVVEHPVPIALFSIKFDREAPRIPGGIWASFLATHGGKASDTFCFLANTAEHVKGSLPCFSEFGNKFSNSHKLTKSLISSRTSNSPYAPAPFAWTTRSGIRSRSKWASRSIKWKSWSKSGPFCPTRCEDSGSCTGHPLEVV